jgi:vacuolar-type H+-ATPase subunit E/Vma4
VNLAPLREALLEAARTKAEESERRDSESAEARLAAAREEAERLVEEGRLVGERAAAREAARTRAAAVRLAREAGLRAERALLDELRSRAREGALALRADPRYGLLLSRLAETARSQLGPEAELERDPAAVGGLIARAGARSVDYTLPALVDRAIETLGDRLQELWR